MTKISEYNENQVRTAYKGVTIGLTLNAGQPMVVENLLKALEEIKARANELGIEL